MKYLKKYNEFLNEMASLKFSKLKDFRKVLKPFFKKHKKNKEDKNGKFLFIKYPFIPEKVVIDINFTFMDYDDSDVTDVDFKITINQYSYAINISFSHDDSDNLFYKELINELKKEDVDEYLITDIIDNFKKLNTPNRVRNKEDFRLRIENKSKNIKPIVLNILFVNSAIPYDETKAFHRSTTIGTIKLFGKEKHQDPHKYIDNYIINELKDRHNFDIYKTRLHIIGVNEMPNSFETYIGTLAHELNHVFQNYNEIAMDSNLKIEELTKSTFDLEANMKSYRSLYPTLTAEIESFVVQLFVNIKNKNYYVAADLLKDHPDVLSNATEEMIDDVIDDFEVSKQNINQFAIFIMHHFAVDFMPVKWMDYLNINNPKKLSVAFVKTLRATKSFNKSLLSQFSTILDKSFIYLLTLNNENELAKFKEIYLQLHSKLGNNNEWLVSKVIKPTERFDFNKGKVVVIFDYAKTKDGIFKRKGSGHKYDHSTDGRMYILKIDKTNKVESPIDRWLIQEATFRGIDINKIIKNI